MIFKKKETGIFPLDPDVAEELHKHPIKHLFWKLTLVKLITKKFTPHVKHS